MIKTATSISRLLFSYANTVLIPLAGSNLTIRRDMTQRTAQYVSRIDGKINALIQRTIDIVLHWTAQILSRQQKKDYRPKEEEDINLSNLQTPNNAQAVTFLEHIGGIARENLGGNNLGAFLVEIGEGVHHLLMEHFKKFSVNATGGLLLTKYILHL